LTGMDGPSPSLFEYRSIGIDVKLSHKIQSNDPNYNLAMKRLMAEDRELREMVQGFIYDAMTDGDLQSILLSSTKREGFFKQAEGLKLDISELKNRIDRYYKAKPNRQSPISDLYHHRLMELMQSHEKLISKTRENAKSIYSMINEISQSEIKSYSEKLFDNIVFSKNTNDVPKKLIDIFESTSGLSFIMMLYTPKAMKRMMKRICEISS